MYYICSSNVHIELEKQETSMNFKVYFSQQSLSIAALPVEKMLQNCNLQEGKYFPPLFEL